jgi:drug/metabolite transporter (DMT)-like permease
LLKKPADVFNFLGFIGIFGLTTTLIEATLAGEFSSFKNIKEGVPAWKIVANYLGMAFANFICYTIIPFFITRCGATLLNLSNVTTIIWSMLADILLFNGEFYPLYLLAFIIELAGIILFSYKEPERPLVQQI